MDRERAQRIESFSGGFGGPKHQRVSDGAERDTDREHQSPLGWRFAGVLAQVLNSSIGNLNHRPNRMQGGFGIGYLPAFFFGFGLVAFRAHRSRAAAENPMREAYSSGARLRG